MQAPVSVPTWTGQQGAAGAPAGGSTALRQPRFGTAQNPRLRADGAGPSGVGFAGGAGGALGGGFAGTAAGFAGGSAPASADLIARMRERAAAIASAGADQGPEGVRAAGGTLQGPELERAQALTAKLVSFLESRGGAAESRDVLEHFEEDGSLSAHDAPLFKQLLRQVPLQGRVFETPPPPFRGEPPKKNSDSKIKKVEFHVVKGGPI